MPKIVKKNNDSTVIDKRKKLKTFLTRFKLKNDPAEYRWQIKAYDFEEAEMICKRISHKLDGLKG